jgi:hypothetical protein
MLIVIVWLPLFVPTAAPALTVVTVSPTASYELAKSETNSVVQRYASEVV